MDPMSKHLYTRGQESPNRIVKKGEWEPAGTNTAFKKGCLGAED